MVSIAESEQDFRKSLDGFGAEYSDSLTLKGNSKGRATLLPCNRSVIRIVDYPSSARDHGILSHEIHHIVFFLLDRIGMRLDDASFEAYAYLHGYITEKIYECI